MRLKQWDRVRYAKNPLVEVVAQVRFPRVLEIDDQLPSDFQRAMREDYPLLETQEEATLSAMIGQGPNKIMADDLPKRAVYHFIAPDRGWRISLCSEFIALTCDKYEQWEGFRPRMMAALEAVAKLYSVTHWTRMGLRYRDLIIREDIGLKDVPGASGSWGRITRRMGRAERKRSETHHSPGRAKTMGFAALRSTLSILQQYRTGVFGQTLAKYTRVSGMRPTEPSPNYQMRPDVPWRELIAPCLLGVTIADGLAEGDIPETDVLAAQSYVSFQLEDCVLGLRHGIVRKEQTGDQAYIIDADFYLDNQVVKLDLDAIKQYLDRFHANAGAVFRGCIQQRLHNALDPQPISS